MLRNPLASALSINHIFHDFNNGTDCMSAGAKENHLRSSIQHRTLKSLQTELSPSFTAMKPLLLLALLCGSVLTSCTNPYPLGHSRNGSYFGGQGVSTVGNNYVPVDLRREQEIF